MTLRKWSGESARVVHADQWIDVRAERVVTGGGVTVDPYYVLHYPDWVHVVAVTPDDRMVMRRQYRHAAGEFGLELPGGAVDAPVRCSRRRVRGATAAKTSPPSAT